jgi:hypothetical protein
MSIFVAQRELAHGYLCSEKDLRARDTRGRDGRCTLALIVIPRGGIDLEDLATCIVYPSRDTYMTVAYFQSLFADIGGLLERTRQVRNHG